MEAFTTLVGQYNSVALTLSDEQFGTIALDSSSRIIFDHSTSSTKIGDGTDILDILVWDAASAGTEKGLMPLGIYKASPTNLADTDGDFVPFQFDGDGRLRVDAEVSVATGSDKAEDSAHTTADIGTYILGVRVDDLTADNSLLLAGTNGDYQSFFTNAKGELYVTDKDVAALLTTIDSVLDNIYTDTQAMVVDLAAIEAELLDQGTTLDNIYTDTQAMVVDLAAIEVELLAQGTTLDSILSDTNDMVVDLAAIEAELLDQGATLDNIETSIDNIEADINSLTKAEDSAHSSGDNGIMALGVSNEAKSDLVSDDGDYTPIATNKKGQVLTVSEVDESGTEEDIGVDEAADGEIDVGTASFVTLATIAVGAGETLVLKGLDLASTVLVAGRIAVYDDTTLTKVIRKFLVVENNPTVSMNWLRGIEVSGGANITVQLQAKCLRAGKTAKCGGGINAYK